MKIRPFQTHIILAVFAGLFCIAGIAPAEDTPTTKPVPAAKNPELVRKWIGQLETYYADLYGKPLADSNRLSHLIAVMSLSRINGNALTEKLLEALADTKDPDALVGQLAWEALHARQASLTPQQRAKWLDGGLALAGRGGFPSYTVTPLLNALAERPVAAKDVDAVVLVLGRVMSENDPKRELCNEALGTAAQTLAAWHDPVVTRSFITKNIARRELDRLDLMLRKMPEAPASETDPTKVKAVWTKYAQSVALKPAAADELQKYTGVSKVFPEPSTITDTEDHSARKDVEMGDLKLTGIDIAFCVDATGSMAASNEYVTQYIGGTMRLLRVMSEQVRAGTVYYRHEIDPALMLDCCRKEQASMARKSGGDYFLTISLPFTPDASALVASMRGREVHKGSGHGGLGAYAGGIGAAIKDLKWKSGAKKIIACTGDAHITTGGGPGLLKLVNTAKENGFLPLFIVRDKYAAADTKEASLAASGIEPIIYRNDIDHMKASPDALPMETFEGTAFHKLVQQVLLWTIPKAYQDRTDPLLQAVIPILRAQEVAFVAKGGDVAKMR